MTTSHVIALMSAVPGNGGLWHILYASGPLMAERILYQTFQIFINVEPIMDFGIRDEMDDRYSVDGWRIVPFAFLTIEDQIVRRWWTGGIA